MSDKVKRRRPGRTRLSSKHQVTLPVGALSKARVQVGDEFRVEVEGDGRILLVRDQDVLDSFVGALPGLSAATNLEALRSEWER